MSEVKIRSYPAIGEKYYYCMHKSGLRIYLVPKKMSATYAVLGVKYGSICDKIDKKGRGIISIPDGTAHFLEHKMFENADGVDTFERFSSLGAQANAFTTFDLTAYLFSCTDNFEKALDVLLESVTSPFFTESNVKKEQGIIAEEIRMGEDNPGRTMMFAMLKSLYSSANVRKEIAGTVQSISEITPEILYDCYDSFYNLNNMVLCVSGDEEMDAVLSSADRVLKIAPPFDCDYPAPEEKESVVAERTELSMRVASPLFTIGIKNSVISRDPHERLKESAAISIIFDALFGKSSDFYNRAYEDGLLNGGLDIWDEHESSFSFVSLSGESCAPEKVYQRFLDTCSKSLANGLCEDDFIRTKRVFYAGIVSSFDSTEEIANNFLEYALAGVDPFDDIEAYASLDLEYVNEVMRKVFVPSHFNLTTVVPIKEN